MTSSPPPASAAAGEPTFEQALAGLRARQPERVVPGLDRIAGLLDLLGAPQRAYPSVHVTGTNGKTSTARMIDALLRGFDLRTGRYTSPQLESVTEVISIDGAAVSPDDFARLYAEVAPYADLLDSRARASDPDAQPVSYFELLTAMAFAGFADAPVDVAVVEVGMGGADDATNVLDAPVVAVTPVSLDHRELGSTVGEIAAVKAGIITPGATVALAVQPVEAAQELLRRAAEVGATVAREGIEFGVAARDIAVGGQRLVLQGLRGSYDDVFLPLHGAHQAHNAALALAAVEALLGGDPLDADLVRAGFAGVESPGRLELVRRSPAVLLDGAHNPAGAQALAAALGEAFTFPRLVGVVGVFGDKDAHGILEALEPVLDSVVVTAPTAARAMPIDDLREEAVDVFGETRVTEAAALADAIDLAVQLAEAEGELGGGVLVTGSLALVGEARRLLRH